MMKITSSPTSIMKNFGISVNSKEAYKKHAHRIFKRRRGYIWLSKADKQIALLRAIERME